MSTVDIERARFNMVAQQIRPWEVLDERILDVVMTTPREAFVPAEHRLLAFADMQIPLPHDQLMMEPKVEARILQAVAPQPSEQALEIGTGSGYLAALLSRLCAHVTSVDIFEDFRAEAEAKLAAQGIKNVTLRVGDAAAGWDDGRRYDVIVVTGSLPELHQGFHKALTIGGRLCLTVGGPTVMETRLITRVGENEWSSQVLFETCLQPLLNAPVTRRFAL